MANLKDYEQYFKKTEDGYVASIGYSSDKWVEIVLKDGVKIPYPRINVIMGFADMRTGNLIYFDKDFNFVRLENIQRFKERKY